MNTAAAKLARFVTEVVSVVCPSCSEPQPNKTDRSEQWTIADFAKCDPVVKCCARDAAFKVVPPSSVKFQ